MKRLLLLTFSICLSLGAYCQSDTTGFELAPEKARFVQPAFNFDYGKALLTVGDFERRLEAGLSLIFFDHYYLIGELGTANLTPDNAIVNGSYSSEGNYFRVGGGYQTQINATSRLGLGARYALSNFSDQGQVRITSASAVQEDFAKDFERPNLEARWLELVIHSESDLRLKKSDPDSKLNRLFSLGFQIRFRFLSTYDQFTPYNVYAIPGYGRTVNNPNLALNVYLKFNPFR